MNTALSATVQRWHFLHGYRVLSSNPPWSLAGAKREEMDGDQLTGDRNRWCDAHSRFGRGAD